MIEIINTCQREVNREFTPVIAAKLLPAYRLCAAESGKGSFKRMKDQLEGHVELNKATMFADSINHIKDQLAVMVLVVEGKLLDKANEVFSKISRDYAEVISGTHLPEGEIMPRAERKCRAAIARAIETLDRTRFENDAKNETDTFWNRIEAEMNNDGNEIFDKSMEWDEEYEDEAESESVESDSAAEG